MTFHELLSAVRAVLPDARLWQDHDGEICVSTRLGFARPVVVDDYGDEELVPMPQEECG